MNKCNVLFVGPHQAQRLKKVLNVARGVVGRRKRAALQRVRRWWRRPFLDGHDEKGAWLNLVQELRETDRDKYFNFMRMTPECFDELLEDIQPFLREDSWRAAVPPRERLAITLRSAFSHAVLLVNCALLC